MKQHWFVNEKFFDKVKIDAEKVRKLYFSLKFVRIFMFFSWINNFFVQI